MRYLYAYSKNETVLEGDFIRRRNEFFYYRIFYSIDYINHLSNSISKIKVAFLCEQNSLKQNILKFKYTEGKKRMIHKLNYIFIIATDKNKSSKV